MTLEDRWNDLWWRLGVQSPDIPATGIRLIAEYSGPDRHYHSRTHLEDVLTKLDWAKTALERTAELPLLPEDRIKLFDTIELALWYHDVVYDAKLKNNEQLSRDLFLTHAAHFGLDETMQQNVAKLIDLTAKHKDAASLMERIMTDCDLAILGAPKAEFDAYDKNIRKEYAHVPAPAYKVGRHKVLTGFLNQPYIFKTQAFHDAYEQQARANLKAATTSPIAKLLRRFHK
ncbi:MAG: phosphohydrolase [bacterium]|nr:phosphohydrolase [bacterium]